MGGCPTPFTGLTIPVSRDMSILTSAANAANDSAATAAESTICFILTSVLICKFVEPLDKLDFLRIIRAERQTVEVGANRVRSQQGQT